MKKFKFLLLFIILNNTGCMNAINHFWNDEGRYPSPAKNRAYDECSQAFDKINPPPPPVNIHSEESRRRTDEFYKYLDKCMKEKGY